MKTCHVPKPARHLLTAIILSVLTVQTAVAGTAFSKIVVFGDSLNDRGNLLLLTNGVFPAPPDFAAGRQSNGPVWVEYLAQRLSMADKMENYAVIGALTKSATFLTDAGVLITSGNSWSDTFPGLENTDVLSQVLHYLADANGTADPAALYILEGGANDFPRVANPAVIVPNLLESFVRLQQQGARHIIVATLPDLGKTPRIILAELGGYLPPGTAAYVSEVCAQLNQALLAALPSYTLPGVTVTIADTYGVINQLASNPAAFGLVEVQLPFLWYGNGGNPAQWLFWDDLHPTTRGHELLAEAVGESLVRTYSPGKGKVGKGAINGLKGLVKAPGR